MLTWHNATVDSNVVTAPGLRYSFQKQIWTTHWHFQRSYRDRRHWWLNFSGCLTPSHGRQWHLCTGLSHPTPFQAVIFACLHCPKLCQILQLLRIHFYHWLISKVPRGGRRAEPAPQRGYSWTKRDVLLDFVTNSASHQKTCRDWSLQQLLNIKSQGEGSWGKGTCEKRWNFCGFIPSPLQKNNWERPLQQA